MHAHDGGVHEVGVVRRRVSLLAWSPSLYTMVARRLSWFASCLPRLFNTGTSLECRPFNTAHPPVEVIKNHPSLEPNHPQGSYQILWIFDCLLAY